jgi:Family of unknown function (DUF6492)
MTLAFITPSYDGDLERCRLLCESMDALAGGSWTHYILVADHDEALFAQLRSSRRIVLPDKALLPDWFKPVRSKLLTRGKWKWLSKSPSRLNWPMSGWHVQQLRKMMVARHITQDALVMLDSDSLFLRPFDQTVFYRDGKVRLMARPGEILDTPHFAWHQGCLIHAAKLLGTPTMPLPATDYIGNMVSWHRENALALLDHIEARSGRDLISTMCRSRNFSEYLIYGTFAENVLGGARHFMQANQLAATHWGSSTLSAKTLLDLIETLDPSQIGIGIQSFSDTPVVAIREAYLAFLRKAV